MLTWIYSNLATVIISLFLIGIVVGIIFTMRKSKKSGKSSCGCNCGHCPMSGSCHKQ